MTLSFHLYQSHALFAQNGDTDVAILNQSIARNEKNKLTGFLHRERNYYLQYLEGPAQALEQTLEKITADPRHSNVATLSSGKLSQRHLPECPMGLVQSDEISIDAVLQGYKGKLNVFNNDPMDLVAFIVSNANTLRDKYKTAS